MRVFLMVIVMFIASLVNGQISVNGGASMLYAFGNPKPFGGFHIGLEVPRDDAVSIYGRYTHHFRQSANTPSTAFVQASQFDGLGNPILPPGGLYSYAIEAYPRMNYNIIEGGTRYYLGNGFDYGFAAYGGSSIMLIFNSVKVEYDDFDTEYYELSQTENQDGTIFSIGFGLGGGVKYSFARLGTFYFDLNVDYMIFAQASNPSTWNAVYNKPAPREWSPLIFNFNLGYRKDILW